MQVVLLPMNPSKNVSSKMLNQRGMKWGALKGYFLASSFLNYVNQSCGVSFCVWVCVVGGGDTGDLNVPLSIKLYGNLVLAVVVY